VTAETPREEVVEVPVQEWMHSRKGRIRGAVIFQHDDWVQIQLAGDHALKYMSVSNRGRVDTDGEVITVRRSFLREVTP
jgi:hypothetical protein